MIFQPPLSERYQFEPGWLVMSSVRVCSPDGEHVCGPVAGYVHPLKTILMATSDVAGILYAIQMYGNLATLYGQFSFSFVLSLRAM
jgi:hypothetical protein